MPLAAAPPSGASIPVEADSATSSHGAIASTALAPAIDARCQRPDHHPDLLAKRRVAETGFAHLHVHVGDEAFGQSGAKLPGAVGAAFQPYVGQGQQAGEHREAPVQSCPARRRPDTSRAAAPRRRCGIERPGFGSFRAPKKGRRIQLPLSGASLTCERKSLACRLPPLRILRRRRPSASGVENEGV